jgi:serine/threonine-protein kinase
LTDDAAVNARVGSVLNDKWKLERLLGIGGMGAVYAARHVRNGSRAAVKILHPELARLADVRERFLQEGRAANAVQHTGVVKVIDDDRINVGPDAGTSYLVMDLLDGQSLEDRLLRGPPLDERELLGMLSEVLDVLAAAHGAGVIHRDLKPENLFFAKETPSRRTQWMVLDFGLARLLDAAVVTGSGVAVGTPAYMSPEQAGGRRDEVDQRADLFSLAATAFRVLTGRRIHEGGTPVEVVLKMAGTPAPRLREVAPEAPEPIAQIVDRALAFKRDDRYPDARAMRADVLKVLSDMAPTSGLKTTVDVEAPTILAMRASAGELLKTIDVSASDLEPSGAFPPPRALAPTEPAAGEVRPLPKRRRSLIPLAAVLVLAGVATKLALDVNASRKAAEAPLVDAGTPTEITSAVPRPEPTDATSASAASAPPPDASSAKPSPAEGPHSAASGGASHAATPPPHHKPGHKPGHK